MNSQHTGELRMSGEYSIRNAADLSRSLATLLGGSASPVSVHTGAVTALDTAALQVLLAAGKTAKAKQQGFVVQVAPGGPVLKFLASLGACSRDGTFNVPEWACWSFTNEHDGRAAA